MKPGLSLRTSQQLVLTPQLQQAIRLLQLSTLELEGEIEQMLADNPFLEREDAQAEPDEAAPPEPEAPDRGADAAVEADEGPEGGEAPSTELEAPRDWAGETDVPLAPDDREWELHDSGPGAAPEDAPEPGERGPAGESLQEHLQRQALALRLAPEDAAALHFLIESLDDDGYLPDSLAQLAATLTDEDDDLEALEQLVHHFTLALRLLQSMEPTGVGARNLAECLLLQLRARRADAEGADAEVVDLALRLCALPEALDLMARRDLRRLAQAAGADEGAVQAALALVAQLEPKPGRRFVQVEHQIVVPDVIVSASGPADDPQLRVQLNPDVVPRLRVHAAYARALRGAGEGHAALDQHLQEARWFVRNIRQRFDTILRVARAIVERQRDFFIHGELAMQPLVQRDLAEGLGVHESTISRVTTAKYMATPRGTYELKYFFGSALATEAGGSASSTAVRALIRQLVEDEDACQPLSDNRIAELLREQGIDCARRTVAKYREGMRIPVAALRRNRG